MYIYSDNLKKKKKITSRFVEGMAKREGNGGPRFTRRQHPHQQHHHHRMFSFVKLIN